MKTINSLNGLASSLLLNVGLTQIAQKLDPISNNAVEVASVESCGFTAPCNFTSCGFTAPCNFTPKSGV